MNSTPQVGSNPLLIDESTERFLRELWRGAPGQPAMVYWWTSHGRRSTWFNAKRPAGEWPAFPADTDVYFGIHPSAAIPTTNAQGEAAPAEVVRSQIAGIAAINCLFAEFDAKDGHSLATVEALTPAPNAIVFSGGGWHCYWLLGETFFLNTEADRARAKALQKRWVAFTGGDPDARDLARVLRVPGTFNGKPERKDANGNAPRVEFVRCDLAPPLFYTLDELEAAMPAPVATPKIAAPPAPPAAHTNGNGDGRRAAYLRGAIDDELQRLAKTGAGGRNDATNRAAFALAQLAAGNPELNALTLQQDLIGVAVGIGLSAGEAEKAVGSGWAAGEKEPRGVPPPSKQTRQLSPWWAGYLPDESGQSDAFLDTAGADWRFVAGFEKWYGWNGTHWAADETRRLRCDLGQMLDEVFEAKSAESQQMMSDAKALDPQSEEGKTATRDAKAAQAEAYAWRKTDRRLNAVDNLCRDRRAVHTDYMGAKNLLNLANGTLDLTTYAFRSHDRGDLLTHCQPYSFDPAATCPRWLLFLAEVLVKEDGQTPDPDLAALFQEAVGYSLTTETRHETMFWLSGAGANGKSTALGVVHALLGSLAKSLDLDALARPDAGYYLARLGAARVIFSTENKEGQRAAEETLKLIVSGEPISARPIRGDPITIKPVAKVWWAMNNRPSVKDTSDGFWRRLRLLPFHRKFPESEKDLGLPDKLAAELPGILNWAIEGLRRLRTNKRFTDAAAVRAAVAEYRTSQNALQLWLDERTTHGLPEGQRPDARTRSRAAFNDYRAWAAETNRKSTITETAFGTELGKLVPKIKVRGGHEYPFGLLEVGDPPTAGAPSDDDAAEIMLQRLNL
jgi:putative DNA primase/helicase